MMSIKRVLALLLAALLMLTLPAMATEVEIPSEAPTSEEQLPVEQPGDAPLEMNPQEEVPEEALPQEEVPVEALPEEDALVEDIAEALPEEESPEALEEEDILASAAGELPEEAPREEDPQGSFEVTEEAVLGGAADNEALFQGYAADVLGLERAQKNRCVGLELSGANGKLYTKLVQLILQVAAGQRTSTEFTLTPSDIGAATVIPLGSGSATADALSSAIGLNFTLVLDTMTSDYPYQLYWFDKTLPATLTYRFNSVSGGVQLTAVMVKMRVCREYAAGDYVLNTSALDTVKRAAANAQAIVASYKSRTDVQKVQGYVAEICSRVTYNSAAVHQEDYGNPWQIVWVFDGDSSTNVVCEGYAKALKYLCDLTSFTGNVHCYTLTGTMSGLASGAHMWNVVTMADGRNYLVDATFADSGYTGLVLATPSKVITAGRSYSFSANGRTATYSYDELSMSVFPASVRTLATGTTTVVTPPAVQSVALTPGGTIWMVVGEMRVLTPSYSPAGADPQGLAWASSNGKVVSVNASGVIRANRKGAAIVAVRTGNGKIAMVTVQVVKKAKVKKVYLSRRGTIYLPAGSFFQLSAAYTPWNARAVFKWSSNKKAVAVVNGSGLVYARSRGKATITVKAGSKKARVKVIVY